MKILGSKFDKITAEKFKEIEGEISLKSNFNLSDVEKAKFQGDEKDVVFAFPFSYNLDYDDVAKIEFSGEIYMSVDKKIAKDLEKDKKFIPDELKTHLLNFILFKTHVEAMHLEERLNLPFHIAAPRASLTPPNASKE